MTIKINPEALVEAVTSQLYGQDDVVRAIAHGLEEQSKRVERKRPLGVLLFAGQPGTGKTEAAKILARKIFGEDGDNLILVEMARIRSVSELIGSKPGFFGSDRDTPFIAALKAKKRGVVLLDEIDQSSAEVLLSLVSAFGDGEIQTGSGKKISTKDFLFVLTTEASPEMAQMFAKESSETVDLDARSMMIKALLARNSTLFRPEFLDRIDKCYGFKPLEGADKDRLIRSEIER